MLPQEIKATFRHSKTKKLPWQIRWGVEHGEHRSSHVFKILLKWTLFFNLEKKNGQNQLIHFLDGIVQNQLILGKGLWSSSQNSTPVSTEMLSERFFDNLPQVTAQANTDLECPLTVQELQMVRMSMENGKAPGIDGLRVDFNKSFWSTLGKNLFEVINDSLPGAVLTLLPKKGDLCEIKNWRLNWRTGGDLLRIILRHLISLLVLLP